MVNDMISLAMSDFVKVQNYTLPSGGLEPQSPV